MTFDDIIGHDGPVSILRRALSYNTLAHAYLFSGEAGIGKKMTALALACAVNCLDPLPDNACGRCVSCRKTLSLNHPDVHIIVPDGEEIKIGQVRDAQAVLSLKPFEGRRKVLIIDGAEAMNPAAANAFLKTLEEPAGDSLIILISSMPAALLDTIRSRCQLLQFRPLPRRVLQGVLAERRGLGREDAVFAASLAQGSLGRGLAIDIEEEKSLRADALELWTRVPGMGVGEIMAEAEAISKDRGQLKRFFEISMELLRDAIVFRETGDETLLVHGYLKDAVREWSERAPLGRMLYDMELLDRAVGLLDKRVSGQLVAESLLLFVGGLQDG